MENYTTWTAMAVTLSFDSLFAGMSYGIKNIRVPWLSRFASRCPIKTGNG